MIPFYNTVLQLFLEHPLAQIMGFVAVAFSGIWFITTKDKKFILFTVLASALRWFHFYLMGLWVAAGVSFLDVIKNLLALKYKRSFFWMIILLIFYVGIGYFLFDPENRYSFIPVINAILSLFFVFYLRGPRLKWGFLLVLILWFIYNCNGHSLGGMLSDIILFSSGTLGMIRFSLKK